jgi:hypothetical protein
MSKKRKTGDIELILLPAKRPKKLNLQCIRCDKQLDIHTMEPNNAASFPCVHKGVVFRSSGQFGSSILDCGVGIPGGYQSDIQIILCDDCIEKNGDRINTMTDERTVMVEYTDKLNKGRQIVTEWSDYRTWNDMKKEVEKQHKARMRELKKDKEAYAHYLDRVAFNEAKTDKERKAISERMAARTNETKRRAVSGAYSVKNK